MADDLDEFPVLVGDLRTIARTLNSAYSASMARDIHEQYRQLNTRPRLTNLTIALESAFNKVEGYLAEIDKDDSEPIPS
jgi:inhibitor of KinA sporulation pathway (predicted exonuclease)